MAIDLHWAEGRLARQAAVIYALVAGIGDEQAHWQPSPDDWSVVEVINHLYDEEREDFRQRLDLILRDPTADWPPIHPGAWVTERRYNDRDLATSVQALQLEREKSLAWLYGLAQAHADLTITKTDPRLGSMAAGEMLAAWVAHDCLHIRQLNELNYRYLERLTSPYAVGYAGDW